MPKNPKLNIARYKVQGGELNEYDFHKNQQAFVQQHEPESMIPGTPPEVKADESEKLQELSAGIGKKSPAKGSKKSTKKAAKKSPTKPAKKTSASKRSTSKRATKTTRRSTKKAAKKSGTKTKARKK